MNAIYKAIAEHQALQKQNIFDSFEKGRKSLPIGTINNGYKKVSEGVWKKVSEHGLTKKEHSDRQNKSLKVFREEGYTAHSGGMAKHLLESATKDRDLSESLDDKDYSEEHVLKTEGKKD